MILSLIVLLLLIAFSCQRLSNDLFVAKRIIAELAISSLGGDMITRIGRSRLLISYEHLAHTQ